MTCAAQVQFRARPTKAFAARPVACASVRFSVNAAAVRDDSTRLDERDSTRRERRGGAGGRRAGTGGDGRGRFRRTLFADTDF
ncbi:MAG: hypothetical protein CL994_00145 [Euryarchaeota archaeon]|nr:hypothetical protein [Euryarchaeota archaeon]